MTARKTGERNAGQKRKIVQPPFVNVRPNIVVPTELRSPVLCLSLSLILLIGFLRPSLYDLVHDPSLCVLVYRSSEVCAAACFVYNTRHDWQREAHTRTIIVFHREL